MALARAKPPIWVVFLLLFSLLAPVWEKAARAQALPPASPVRVTLSSALPIGNARVDTIRIQYYAAPNVAGSAALAPAVVIVPPTGSEENDPTIRSLARFVSRNGVHAAVLTLPYHGGRKLPGLPPAGAFVGYDVTRNAHAFRQGASDVSTVVTWLQNAPGVDKNRVAVVGLSLGAIVCHLAMGQDERIGAGVAIVGSGDLTDLYRHSTLAQLYRLLHHSSVRYDTDERFRALAPADPLTYAEKNRPRRVLMIQAARDLLIPPRDATELWEALGRPPIRWVDTNHFALNLAVGSLEKASLFYLRGVWDGKSDRELDATLPRVSVPLFKGGFLAQFGSGSELGFTPAIQWQFASLGTQPRTHRSLFHADLGLSGRGPFVGAGVTVNSFIDFGVASRLTTHSVASPRPYLSFHVAY